MQYREIQKLIQFCSTFKASATQLANHYLATNTSFPAIELSILDKTFTFFVDDEYEDLQVGSNLLSVCLALRALESYLYSEDYLIWCKQHGLNASEDSIRMHFQHLGDIILWFKRNNITIDSFISDYDFELNAGAAQFLRNNPNI